MPCYHPLQAYLPVGGSGDKKVLFSDFGDHGSAIKLPCGQCIGCRLEYSRQWAVRCVHEASLYERNCFITLTYSDDSELYDGNLHVEHFQKFMKRFRKKFPGDRIRFFHCGEYGEKRGRPHYHACIFNFDFSDRVYFGTRKGVKLYTSEVLATLWPDGFSSVGDVTFESAAYVARYVCKKITGKLKDKHYLDNGIIDFDTGELVAKKQEYTTMSRRPGVGAGFLKDFVKQIYPLDVVRCRDRDMRPPKYYDYLYEQDECSYLDVIKHRRVERAVKVSSDSTPDRLLARETVEKAKLSLFGKRDLE
nr:MAG: replication initiator protein [Microviridae sp.]